MLAELLVTLCDGLDEVPGELIGVTHGLAILLGVRSVTVPSVVDPFEVDDGSVRALVQQVPGGPRRHLLVGPVNTLRQVGTEQLVLAGALLVHTLMNDRSGPVRADEGVPGGCCDGARQWVGEEDLGQDVGVTGQVMADELVPPHVALFMGGAGEDRRPAGSGIGRRSHPHGDDRALGTVVTSHQASEGGGQPDGGLVNGQGVVQGWGGVCGNRLPLTHPAHESRVSGMIGVDESRIVLQCLG